MDALDIPQVLQAVGLRDKQTDTQTLQIIDSIGEEANRVQN